MQTDQIQKLTRLIKESPVLQNDERAVWLAMLPVMNDKQAADLFSILQARPKSFEHPAAQDTSPFKAPPLRHITNLPTGMPLEEMQAPPAPILEKPKPLVPPPSPAKIAVKKLSTAEIIRQRIEEKELPAGQELLELPDGHLNHKPAAKTKSVSGERADDELQRMRAKVSEPHRPQTPVREILSSKSENFVALDTLLEEQKKRHEIAASAQSQALESKNDSGPLPTSLEDIGNLEVGTFRSTGLEALKERLVLAVRKDGYFTVQLRFEQSPLYRAYIHTGQAWLSGDRKKPAPLSKQEFEQVTDLLRALQVSQTN